MRTTVVALLALLAVAAAVPKRQSPKFDQVKLTQQRDIVRLLTRYRQPLLWEDLATIAKDYKLQPENYEVPELVEDFVHRESSDEFLAFDEPISVLEHHHVDHIKLFVDLLYHAKDYDTFYKTALYLRERVNKAQFMVSFLISAKLRHDTREFILPPIYEIVPELFITSDAIQQITDYRLQGVTPASGNQYYTIATYTGFPTPRTPDQKLSYFTEDVGLNEYFADFNYRYPYFLSANNYTILNGEVRGDVLFHTLRHLYARYSLERLAHGYPEVAPFDYEKGVTAGYNPRLRLPNGVEFYLRPENQDVLDGDIFALERTWNHEYRVSEVVDMGYVISAKDGRMKYEEIDATDILGNLIQGNADSLNPRYYGAIFKEFLTIVGNYDQTQRYGLAASALGKYETMLRDPAFFQILKRILNIFQQYLNFLEPYTRKELEFPGVKVESVEADRLVTYFDNFDVEVDNALKASSKEEVKKVKVLARQKRLNHKTFTYRIKASSEKPTKAIFRAFFGPRYDANGNPMTLDEARHYFVEFDRFVYDLPAGENEISRSSRDFVTTEHGSLPMAELEEMTERALQGKDDFSLATQFHAGFPHRLLLPRGSREGFPLRLYVIANHLPHGVPAGEMGLDTPIEGDWFTALADGRAPGFPFDRRIPHLRTFRVPNSYAEDVVVYHRTIDEINRPTA